MTEAIKIQLVELRPRSKEGIKRYSPWMRQKLFPFTFHPQRGLGPVHKSRLNTKKNICDLVWQNAGPGTWDVRGVCPNKHARMGFSMKTLVRVTLERHPTNEYTYVIVDWEPRRLRHYKKVLGWKDETLY